MSTKITFALTSLFCVGVLLTISLYFLKENPYVRALFGATPASTVPVSFVKSSNAELRTRLTPIQYAVTQEGTTEEPFTNEYWDSKAEGIYVDIVSGEALFSSRDKYDSGTGWPTFTKPITPASVIERSDTSAFIPRTEVVSAVAGSHLGHVFTDGPQPLGLRYCMNSAALRFISREALEGAGYGEYVVLFK